MMKKCKKEIITLHRFFEEWFHGLAPDGKQTLLRVEKALGKDFIIISPNGNKSNKKTLLQNLEKVHGSWGNEKIIIKNIEARELGNDICLATYEEWQGDPAAMKGRLSSAIFRRAEEAPAGVQWVHLHEVWM